MLTKESNQKFTPRKTRKYGDLQLFSGLVESKFWALSFNNQSALLDFLIGRYWKFQSVILSFFSTAFLRRNFGSHTIGLGFVLMSSVFLLCFNSVHIWKIFVPVFIWVVPFFPFWIELDQIYDLIFVEIRSTALLYFASFHLIAGLIHVGMIWFGQCNPDLTKRGESWVYTIMSRYIPTSEFFVCGIIEPTIVFITAWLIFKFGQDETYALLLALSAANEMFLQFNDKAHQAKYESIIDS